MFHQFWHDLWIILFVLLIIIGVFAGQGLLIGFGVMGLLMAGISWLWNKVALEEVSYERSMSQQRVFIGDEVTLTITLTNRKPVPLGRVEVEDELPKGVQIAGADLVASATLHGQMLRHSTSMAWYERIRWEYRLTCSLRGYHRIGPARIESGDLFGFFNTHKALTEQDYLLVYPQVVPLPELGLPASRPLGELGGGMRISQDRSRPSGLRDYQQTDPLKIMDWKASARAQRLLVRTFEPSSATTLVMVVVVETTAHYWEGYSPSNLERVITTAASVASYSAERQHSLGLFSNGTPILADRPLKIPHSRSPEQLTIILEALATIQPLAMAPMSSQLAEHARRFPIGATLVVIAAFISPELAEVIGTLKGRGYKMVLLYVGDEPCAQMSEGIRVHELRDYFVKMELAREFGPG